MWFLISAVFVAVLCGPLAAAETWRLKDANEWEPVATGPQERYLQAVAEVKKLARQRDTKAVKKALQKLKDDFPARFGPDLELFIKGELQYWRNDYAKAMEKFEKLLKDYPGSEFAPPTLAREFDMADAYLRGRKKSILGIIKFAGYAEGVEIMERISDRAGLDEPNGVGLRAAIAVAEHYERREHYIEAYLKWSEISSYWESGPVGKRALYRMAENNVAAYNAPPPARRPSYDASKLTTARSYYERFLLLYPEEGAEKGIPEKIRRIDEQLAYKQLKIGQYYRRTGKLQAANLYFDMVVQNWPQTEAATVAREALAEHIEGGQAGGK